VPVSIDKSEGLFPMCAELVHAKWRQPLAEYCSLSLRYQVAPQRARARRRAIWPRRDLQTF
jgi:hypothetical protein